MSADGLEGARTQASCFTPSETPTGGLGLSWDALTASFHSLVKHLSSEELQGPSDAAPVSLKGTSASETTGNRRD